MEDDYQEHEERYDSLEEEWYEDAGSWNADRRAMHLENMRDASDMWVVLTVDEPS